MAADFGRRFAELLTQADEIESKKKRSTGDMASWGYEVDTGELLGWKVKCRQLLTVACGKESPHISAFLENENPGVFISSHEVLLRLKAIVAAAKDDYEGGYLNTIRNLIQADVFDTELEQADELMAAGYHVAAAVIAGVVLETTLRQMCKDSDIEPSKLDKMNSDLAKAGAFNRLVQKQITAWAAIRNSAAHGNADQFKGDDVAAMIRDVKRFVADRLS
jgi:hypothetical protein